MTASEVPMDRSTATLQLTARHRTILRRRVAEGVLFAVAFVVACIALAEPAILVAR